MKVLKSLFFTFTAALVLFMMTIVIILNQFEPSSDGCSKSLAQLRAHNQVRNELKAPSTAKFNSTHVESGQDCKFRVSGTVDAQNGFGAMIRNDYSVVVSGKKT